MTWNNLSGSHDKSCLNSLNAKERCFNASFLISILYQRKEDNAVPELLAAGTFKMTHNSSIRRRQECEIAKPLSMWRQFIFPFVTFLFFISIPTLLIRYHFSAYCPTLLIRYHFSAYCPGLYSLGEAVWTHGAKHLTCASSSPSSERCCFPTATQRF